MLGSRDWRKVRRHLDSQNEALNRVSVGRLVASFGDILGTSTAFTVRIGRGDDPLGLGLIALLGETPLLLEVSETLLATTEPEGVTGSLMVSYSYGVNVMVDGQPHEVVAFHWTPNAEPPQRHYPHMHVGSLITTGSRFRRKDFNRLHIPTGRLSLEAVLLFAVEELGVEPPRGRSRDDVLATLREGIGRSG